jgi:hypothetical protein
MPNYSKQVVVRSVDGEIVQRFDSAENCATYYGLDRKLVYRYTNKPHVGRNVNGTRLTFETVGKASYSKHNDPEVLRRRKETEDQTRRRLGLNPYGEWRTDEWINAMIERVDKILYPDGYDHHAEWLRQRAYGKYAKSPQKVEVEDDLEDFEL